MKDTVQLTVRSKERSAEYCAKALDEFVATFAPNYYHEVVAEQIKMAVYEAVANACWHAYPEDMPGLIKVKFMFDHDMQELSIIVSDEGKGIENLPWALKPFNSTYHRGSGLGFTIINGYMDNLEIESEPGEGTIVTMTKKFA